MTEEPPKLEMLNFLKTVPVVHVLHFKHIQINVCVWEDGTVKRDGIGIKDGTGGIGYKDQMELLDETR
jgi:hypothetical protein